MGDDDGLEAPALQVIILGSGGGPQESNSTSFLVRSIAQQWRKGSVIAVDGGTYLSVITKLIRQSFPSPPPKGAYTVSSGPFTGLSLPYNSVSANAGFVTSSLIDAHLITHPHLDHISGFVMNTAGLPGSRPKKLVALPSTIHAFKTHVFNEVIWPNLSDENGGAGLVTYLRLVEGGSPALGDGEGKGYSEVSEGLLVKGWSVSHGVSVERQGRRGSASSNSTRFGSHDATAQTPRREHYPHGSHSQPGGRRQSHLSHATLSGGGASPATEQEKACVVDSSAYFIQDQATRREVLIFGDVEPDSISLSPRNIFVWQEAAPKIVSGSLKAILIECSYDDSQSNDRLFGHLKPIFVIEELAALAKEVMAVRKERSTSESKKRKRLSGGEDGPRRSIPKQGEIPESAVPLSASPTIGAQHHNPSNVLDNVSPLSQPHTPHLTGPTSVLSIRDIDELAPVLESGRQLEGLKVIIIHVKDKLLDGPEAGETILQQLEEHEKSAQLGCEFIISKQGQSFYL